MAAREKSLLLDKFHHELHTLLPILKTIPPLDLVAVTTNSSAEEDVSPLQELTVMAQGQFFLLSLGGSKDGLHPPQGRWCLSIFLGSALCPLLGVKPNTLKMEHFLYETLNSLFPWYYSLTTCLVCEWILITAWHRLEAGLPHWALLIAPFWWKFCCGWLGSSLKENFPFCFFSISRARGGMCSLMCILSHCYFWLCTVRCFTATGPGHLVSE